jgi:hypothetical protein
MFPQRHISTQGVCGFVLIVFVSPIRSWKPWESSTGAKTSHGMAIFSKNFTKTGDSAYVHVLIKQMNLIIKGQKELIDS